MKTNKEPSNGFKQDSNDVYRFKYLVPDMLIKIKPSDPGIFSSLSQEYLIPAYIDVYYHYKNTNTYRNKKKL